MARALKPGAPLAFTYHHNKLEAYFAVGVAILDSGLTCSASLPVSRRNGRVHSHSRHRVFNCRHFVFVCRGRGHAPGQWLFESAAQLAAIIGRDLEQLSAAGHKPTRGDTRCILFGHLTRMAVWNLRKDWNPGRATAEKLERFGAWRSSGSPTRSRSLSALNPADARPFPPGRSSPWLTPTKRTGNAVAF